MTMLTLIRQRAQIMRSHRGTDVLALYNALHANSTAIWCAVGNDRHAAYRAVFIAYEFSFTKGELT